VQRDTVSGGGSRSFCTTGSTGLLLICRGQDGDQGGLGQLTCCNGVSLTGVLLLKVRCLYLLVVVRWGWPVPPSELVVVLNG
jgi:hypothetical protein